MGATICNRPARLIPQVSIHAPVWVRRVCRHDCLFKRCFNSRTRVGATLEPCMGRPWQLVSIHAPVWVRLAFRTLYGFASSFNSRTRVGATCWRPCGDCGHGVSIHAPVWVRPVWTVSCLGSKRFQFTHPCGCDPRPRDIVNFWISFNSRTRVGATSKPKPSTDKQHVSIHAPVWVRPRNPFVCRLIFRVSIHAPVWVRRQKRIVTGRDMEFQFTHPCGCDSVGMRGIVNPKVSIHAPVWVRLYKTYQQ